MATTIQRKFPTRQYTAITHSENREETETKEQNIYQAKENPETSTWPYNHPNSRSLDANLKLQSNSQHFFSSLEPSYPTIAVSECSIIDKAQEKDFKAT